MIEETFYNVKFSFDNGIIKVNNFSEKTFRANFLNPDIGFFGFNYMNLKPNMWVSTDPKSWKQGSVNKKVIIILTSQDTRYDILFNYNEKKFTNITDEYCKINNYEIVKKKISVVITAFNSAEYIDETINRFLEIITKKSHLDVEILIGIDGCPNTVRHISNKSYPNYVHVLFSEKNYGMTLMKNSLIFNASNEKVLLFDSDDIPTEDLIDIVYDELENNDFVYYKHYQFKDGEDYKNTENLKQITSSYMGGTFGMNRERFLEINGFFPWRVQSDDEFKRRLAVNGEKYKVVDEPLFYYRIRQESLSRNKKFGIRSIIRRIYLDLMTNKNMHNVFENPERFKYNDKLIYIQ